MDLNKNIRALPAWGGAVVAVLLVFAPLMRGGNRPIPLLVLEILAVVLLVLLAMRPVFLSRLGIGAKVFVAGALALPLIQLLPIPYDWWASMPGRPLYAAVYSAAGIAPEWRSISVIPYLTESSLLTLLPALAVFLMVISLGETSTKRLVGVFLAMALFQAILSLMQYGSGEESLLYLGLDGHGYNGVGTYANRNHLSGLMEMAMPTSLAMLAASVFGMQHAAQRRHRSRRASLMSKLGAWVSSEVMTNKALLYGAITLALILGAVFSRSRTGIGLIILGLIVTSVLLMRNFGKGFGRQVSAVVAGLGVVLAASVGLAPVYARFGNDPMSDLRWTIFESSLRGVAEFFPLGSGMGSYPDVMRAFYPSGIGRQINHAHNDYIEWLFEGGLLAALLIVLFLVLYLVRWRALWADRNWHSLHMMQVGAGVGLLLILLHGLTDYNLRIPANLIYAAFLAGVFFRTDDSGAHHHRKPRHADAVDATDTPAVPETSADAMQAGTTASPDAMAEPVPGAGPTHVEAPPEPEPAATQAPRKRNPFDA